MKELGVLPWQQRTNALSVVQHKKTHTDDWRLYYPRAFETQMPQGLSETNKLLLWSIMRAESYYKPRARSHVGAMGLMQIMPYTGVRIAKDLGEDSFNRSSLESPEVALRYGSYYVDRLMEYFGNPFMALAAYNAGPANVKFWAQSCNGCGVDEFIESIPFKETRKYVKKITKTYLTYRQIYDADQNIEETREISLSSIREGMRMY
jgi:soluble lytic murein transglycosylase